MAEFGDVGRDLSLDFMTGNTAVAPPTWFVDIHDGAPGIAGTDNLAAGSGARIAASWGAAVSGVADNDADIDFPISGAAPLVSHVSIHSLSAAGVCYYQGPLDTPVQTADGGTLSFPAGQGNIAHIATP